MTGAGPPIGEFYCKIRNKDIFKSQALPIYINILKRPSIQGIYGTPTVIRLPDDTDQDRPINIFPACPCTFLKTGTYRMSQLMPI